MTDRASDAPDVGELAPRLDELMGSELLVPIRSSSGTAPDPATIPVDAFRHGTDDSGERFLAAFTTQEVFEEFGPPGSDHVRISARELFSRADSAGVRVVVDPGAPTQVEVASGVLPYLAAGLDPSRPDALRARRPVGETPQLEAPDEIPQPFGTELHAALEALPQVERAWLLRAGDGWTAGIQMTADAVLADFDQVRNRLHAVATEHLGSRRHLAVTDVRAAALRDAYDSTAAPFYVRRPPRKGLLSRLTGG